MHVLFGWTERPFSKSNRHVSADLILFPSQMLCGHFVSVQDPFFYSFCDLRIEPTVSHVKAIQQQSSPYFLILLNLSFILNRKEQELSESGANNENLLAQIESLKKKIRELEVSETGLSSSNRKSLLISRSRDLFLESPEKFSGLKGQSSNCNSLLLKS